MHVTKYRAVMKNFYIMRNTRQCNNLKSSTVLCCSVTSLQTFEFYVKVLRQSQWDNKVSPLKNIRSFKLNFLSNTLKTQTDKKSF